MYRENRLVSLTLYLLVLSSDNLCKQFETRMVFIGLDKQNFFESKIVNMFLPISFNICFGCSKEPSH